MGEMGWAKPFTQRINKSNIKVTQKKVNSRAGNMAIKIWEWYFYSKHSSGTTRLYFIHIREYGEHFTYMAGYKTNDGFYSGKCDTISSFDSHFTRYHIKCYNVMEAWKPTCKCTNMPETNLLELYSSIMNFIQSEINEECEICWSGISSAHLEHCLFWHGLIM